MKGVNPLKVPSIKTIARVGVEFTMSQAPLV
jgi:hypothetical protein